MGSARARTGNARATERRRRQPRAGLRVLGAALLCAALLALPAGIRADDGAPIWLAGAMHENLAALNDVMEGVARDDFDLVRSRGERLAAAAKRLEKLDLETVGLDPGRAGDFDKHLAAQQQAALEISGAAKRKDAAGVLRGTQTMLERACIPCHNQFRRVYAGHKPSVLFMRTLLSSVQTMNWGLVIEDYSAVAREARAINRLARLFDFPQVAEALFGITDAAEQKEFGASLSRLLAETNRMESAALTRDAATITQAFHRMLADGCVRCHQRFRTEQPAPAALSRSPERAASRSGDGDPR